MITCSAENVYEGATVYTENGSDSYFVYKVNTKSMYIGKAAFEEITNRWDNRPKGTTFKDIMKDVNGRMVNFGPWKIKKEEADKKEAMDKINKTKKNQKSPITKQGETAVKRFYKHFLKEQNGVWKAPVEIGKNRFIIIDYSKDEFALVHCDEGWFFYDLRDGLFHVFDKDKDKNGKEIIWPKREYEVA